MRFMVSFKPRAGCSAQLRETAPAELAHAKKMRDAGILRELFVSAPGHAWLVLETAQREEVEALLSEFPMYPYVEATIDSLLN
jgi:muconolactone delta-isomerase